MNEGPCQVLCADYIEENEAKFYTLFNNVHDAIFLNEIDENGELGPFVEVNDEACRRLGYNREELLSMHPRDVEGQDDSLALRAALDEVLRNGSALYRNTYIARDGKRIIAEINARQLILGGKRMLLSATRDVSEQQLMIEELALSEHRYRSLLDGMNELFFTLNINLRITFANRKFVHELEYSEEEIIGQPVTMLVPQEMKRSTIASFKRLIRDKSSREFVTRVQSKSGREIMIKVQASPIIDKDELNGVMLLAEDVTESTRQAAELQEREELMRQITDNMLDMVTKLSSDLKIEYISPSAARILGYEAADLKGLSIFYYMHPEDRKDVRMMLEESGGRGQSSRTQYRIRSKEGRFIWLESYNNPLMDRTGNMTGYIVGSRDVTDRIEYEKALEDSRRKYEALFDSMQEGFALWEVVRDRKGAIKDFRYLDVNPAYVRATRLDRDSMIGRLASKFGPHLDANWTSFLEEVAETCEPRNYEGFHTQLKRYLEVFAFCPGPDLVACLFVDSTRRNRIEKQMADDRNWLSVVLGSVNEGIVATDVEGKVLFMNHKAASIMGWSEEETIGQYLSDLFSRFQTVCLNPDPGLDKDEEAEEEDEKITLADNIIFISRGGKQSVISNSSAPIKDTDGQTLGMVMVLTDITDQRLAQEQIEYLSFNDTLTGLHNRAFIDHMVSTLDHENQLPTSIILGDVNGLKLTNDVFGHQAGDALLSGVAHILKGCCRDTDIVARWGGDEFLILLPKSSEEVALRVCERIRNNCAEAGDDPIEISISLGCATRTTLQHSLDELFRVAEDDMYNNKTLEKEQSRGAIISSLERNLWRWSNESPEHNERIREIVLKIAERLQLGPEDKEKLSLLASLHDIGKIGIERDILGKVGEYTDEERQVMRKHTEIGYRMASAVPELKAIADYILYSHESWDGSGYPRGLHENEIPLMARIIYLAHSYDVAAYGGSYRAAAGLEQAQCTIKNESGRLYDPRLVEVLLDILQEEAAGEH